jgi:trimethylamine--corrinoid protein Co-methyltransferase
MTRSDSELHSKPSLKVLGNDQIEKIHAATLEVLERTGVRITHPKALDLMEGAGANVDGDRVRIPARMVEDAILKAPSSFALGKRNGEPAVLLEGNKSWYGAGLDCVDYLDPVTDERRRFTIKDCRITAKIANALPNYSWVMTLGLAADAPADITDQVIAKQALTYCEKPLAFCCNHPASLYAIYDMAILIMGREERFRKAPSIALLSSAVSPLSYYDDTVEKIIFCAERGIPQVFYSGLQTGGTSPATFAGTIVQGSAESLSGIVLAQLVRAGAPVVYGAFTTIMDMATAIFSYGAPEMSLMAAAMAQMAQRYNLPFFGTAGCTDAKFSDDPQAAIEATFSCLSSTLSGANLVHDIGLLDHSTLISPNYLVLNNEVLHMVNQYMRGIPVNSETLAVDLIDRVGPGGHYLEQEHTVQHFRDVWYSVLFDRSNYNDWFKKGARRFKERLREQTRKLMDLETASLPKEIVEELDCMEKQWGDESGR